MHGHERGKIARRRRILCAVREMVGETGTTQLSMRSLAERTDVSVVTIYNLFGSKQGVLSEVLAADLDNFIAINAMSRSASGMERIFRTLELATGFYRREPKFYKALFAEVFRSGTPDIADMFNPPRIRFWTDLVRAAMAEGALLDEFAPALIARMITHIFGSLVLEWVQRNDDLTHFNLAVQLEFCFALAGVASDAGREMLLDRARVLQAELRAAGYDPEPTSPKQRVEAAG